MHMSRELLSYANGSTSRNPFTPSEDARLKELVSLYGENDWESISREMGNRNVRQCRERWFCFIGNLVRKGEWSTEEDAILLEKYRQYGSKWKFFETFLPGRKCYAIRNRLHLLMRRMEALGPTLHVPPRSIPVCRALVTPRIETSTSSSEETGSFDVDIDLDDFIPVPNDVDWFLPFA